MINRFKNIFNAKLKRTMEKNDIDMEELERIYKKGAILIDVRSPQEYNEGHLQGAICIPSYELKRKIKKVMQDKNKDIIVYCSTGSRSKKAKRILESIGYTNVYNLYNGFQNYWDFKIYMIEYAYKIASIKCKWRKNER